MNKQTVKTISLILALTTILSTAAGALAPGRTLPGAEMGQNDPFAAMFDADAELAERLDELVIRMKHDPSYQAAAAPPAGSGTGQGSGKGPGRGRSDEDEALVRQAGELKALATEGRAREFESLGSLPATLVGEAARIRDEVYFDSYIVKYKETGSRSLARYSFTDGAQAEPLPCRREGRLELLTLTEKVNPGALAGEIRSAGAGREIEYIQPNVALSLSAPGEGRPPGGGRPWQTGHQKACLA